MSADTKGWLGNQKLYTSTAIDALRTVLHMHGVDNTAREHLERAMSHACEAYIALNEPKSARTVPQLAGDLEKVARLMEKLTNGRSRTGVVTSQLPS
jgi:hypothetical protein